MSITFQHNIDLQSYNTLSVPAKAQAFISVNTVDELKAVLTQAKDQYKQLLVLGSGSNMVLPDLFEGLVVHMAIQGYEVEEQTQSTVNISFAAGENWHKAVMSSVDKGWFGIENLALIPGTVGAAPVQNIGAYGVELKDRLVYLEAIHIASGELKRFSREQCQFAYRDSFFKQAEGSQWVIVRVVLQLSKDPTTCLEYPALKKVLAATGNQEFTARQIADAVIHIRQSKLPDPETLPNAGSFFKNPIIDQSQFSTLLEKYPNIAHFIVDESHIKIAAGWLLEQDGWKGKLVDGIGMHKDQALVLINPNGLPAKNITDFASLIKASIKKKFNITLEIEPMIIASSANKTPSSQSNV